MSVPSASLLGKLMTTRCTTQVESGTSPMKVFMSAMLHSAAKALSLIPLSFSRFFRERTTRGFGVTKIEKHYPASRRLSNSLTELTVELIMDLVVLDAKVRGVDIGYFNSDGVTFVTHLEVESHDTWRDNCDRSNCSNQTLVDPHLESK